MAESVNTVNDMVPGRGCLPVARRGATAVFSAM